MAGAGAALSGVPMVTEAEDLPILRRYWRTVFGKQLTARAAVTVPNLYAVLSAVDAGAGYSVLPRSLCQEYLDSAASPSCSGQSLRRTRSSSPGKRASNSSRRSRLTRLGPSSRCSTRPAPRSTEK